MARLFVMLLGCVGLLSSPLFAGSIYLKNRTLDTSRQELSISVLRDGVYNPYRIIQLSGVPIPQIKGQLAGLNVELYDYLPDNAYIAYIPERVLPLIDKIAGVQWLEEYRPEYRVEMGLASLQDETQEIYLSLFPRTDRTALESFILSLGGQIVGSGSESVVIRLRGDKISRLASFEGIRWIEKRKPVEFFHYSMGKKLKRGNRPTAPLTGYETGVKILETEPLYEMGINGQGQIVGVGDTGLDIGELSEDLHPDFKKNQPDGKLDYKVLKGYVLGFYNETWADSIGHGTHVAGSILGTGQASGGLLHGVAYGADLVVQSLTTGFGTFYVPANLEELFQPSFDDGARIHSDSWGNTSDSGPYDQYAHSADDFVWHHPEFLPVFAAGNGGVDGNGDGVVDEGSVASPSSAKNVLAVGASENFVLQGGIQKKWKETKRAENWPAEPISSDHLSDNPNGLAAFSSRGPTSDGRIKPDVVAPGTNILSTKSHYPDAQELWGPFDDNYVWGGGTSMATPLTAGSLLLLRQFLIEQGISEPSAALLKATLIHGAIELYPGQFGLGGTLEIPTARPNFHEGWGRVNLASSAFLNGRRGSIVDHTHGLATGDSETVPFRAYGKSEPLRATLVYTDYPGSLVASKSLVNDLDLRVVAPDGTVYYPNGKTNADDVNNVEQVEIAQPQTGEYQIVVGGTRVAQGQGGRQPYALVVSGK